MNFDYQHRIPENFSTASRVWIYQSNRIFSTTEIPQIEITLANFVAIWKSHGAPVKGFATLLFGQFIIVMADETTVPVGGCSTDSSTQMIKQLEATFAVDLFNRQSLAFVVNDNLQTIPLAQLNQALENGLITPDTRYFNNTVLDKTSLLTKWMLPLKDSWLAKKMAKPIVVA